VTLSGGRAPLSPTRAGRFSSEVPDTLAYIEPYRRRVRAVVDGRTVIDSEEVLLVHRPTMPWYGFAFPEADVPDDVRSTPVPDAPGYVRVSWEAVDQWIEEDEPVLGYVKNPYHRVDCLRSARHIEVRAADTVLADTDATVVLYETALEPRIYVRKEDVRMELLRSSATTTFCGYKGAASYWDAVVGDVTIPDVAWSYEDPLPDVGCEMIRGRLSFDELRVTLVHDLPSGSIDHVRTAGTSPAFIEVPAAEVGPTCR